VASLAYLPCVYRRLRISRGTSIANCQHRDVSAEPEKLSEANIRVSFTKTKNSPETMDRGQCGELVTQAATEI